jgi:hypothetical protein
MPPTMEVGPESGPAADAVVGDGWWVHDGLALAAGWCVHLVPTVSWCVHQAPPAGLVEGLASPLGHWSQRGQELLMPRSNW